MVSRSALPEALRRVHVDRRRAAAVLALQPLVALAAVRVPGIDQFPGVLLLAGGLAGAYWAGALLGLVSVLEALAVWFAIRPAGGITHVSTGGIVTGVAVVGVAGVALVRALERERASRAEVADEQDRYRRLLDMTFDAIVLSADGTILDVNAGFERLAGLRRDDAVGRDLLEFVAPASQEVARELIVTRGSGPIEVDAFAAGGAPRVVRVVSQDVVHRGRPARLSAIKDISAERRLESQMRQKQKMEAIGQLAGGIAHDFNNLLTVIGGNVLLAGTTELPEDARGYVAEISAAADRAGALTRQLLTFSRAQEPELREVDLDELVVGLEGMLARLIGTDVVVDVRLAPDLPLVLADPVQLELVLINLAANARDAMSDGGRLTIRTEAAGTAVALSVSDTGTGMDEATRERVFEPFFTTKRAGEGTGLGLANVYGIVMRAGGEIEVESELGVGTTFRVLLPAVEPAPEPPFVGDADEAEPTARTGSVLFVDDEPSVRRIAGVALAHAGHDTVLAASGEEALDLLADGRRVDLLVTDLVMPGMNGIELAERVRAEHPGIAILFVSGYADRVLAAGAGDEPLDVLDKPFTPTVLAERVAQALCGR